MWVGAPDDGVSLKIGLLGLFYTHFEGDFLAAGKHEKREKLRIPQHYGATHCRQRE